MTPQPRLQITWFIELDKYDGMNRTKNNHIPTDWIEFTKTSYFEFGETYNLQCWRLMLSPESPQQIAKYITSTDKIYYKNKPLKFSSIHIF
jgi:hypothetical protein